MTISRIVKLRKKSFRIKKVTRDKNFYYQYSRLENKEKHTVVEIVFYSNISIGC